MSTFEKHILIEALKLPAVERAELVEHILSSFEFSSRKKNDVLWAKEAENRLDAFKNGKITSISAKAVFEKIEKREK